MVWFLILAFHCFSSYADVQLDTGDDAIFARDDDSSTPFSLLVENIPTNGASQLSNPIRAYVPISNADGNQREHVSILDSSLVPTVTNGELIFKLDLLNTFNQEIFLYVAIQDDGLRFYNAGKLETLSSGQSISDFSAVVNIANFCGLNIIDCANLDTSTDRQAELTLYFFLSEQEYRLGDIISFTQEEIDQERQLFVRLFMSNQIFDSGTVELLELKRGDRRLFARYRGSELSNKNKVIAAVLGGANNIAIPFRTANIMRTIESDEAEVEDTILITELDNGNSYDVAVAFENKYQLTTYLSNSLSRAPEDIDILLRENSCFILTAGFAGDHQVVDYFRHIRDDILIQSSLGKSIINFYYYISPSIAKKILEHPSLAFLVRILAWTTLIFLKLWWIFLILPLIYFIGRRYGRA